MSHFSTPASSITQVFLPAPDSSARPPGTSLGTINAISGNPNDVTRPRKRRRPALACFECRRRKVKCDRNHPCSPCIQSKFTSCEYDKRTTISHARRTHEGRLPGSSSHQLPPSDPPRAVDAESLIINHFPTPDSLTKTSSVREASHSAEQSPLPGIPSPPSDRTTEQLLQRIKDLEKKLSDSQKSVPKSPGTGNDQDIQRSSSSHSTSSARPQSMRGSLSKTRMYGQSHWCGHFEEFQSISPFNFWSFDSSSFVREERFIELCTLLDKSKKIARAIKAQRPSRWLIPPEEDFKNYVPHRERADKLVDAYFRCFESTYRVLHVPSFRCEYAQYWAHPELASIGFVVKLFLVMTIGASLHKEQDGSTQDISDILRWFYAAQTWLSTPFEKSRFNLSGLQIHCLLLIARQIGCVAPDLVWVSVGSLLRTAMQMGLHRDPKYFPKMSVLHMEIRRRLWATILELCVQSAIDCGMPPGISSSEYDTDPPLNINDTDIDETTLFAPIPQPETVFTQTSIQIVLLKSLHTRLEVARLANDTRTEPTYDTILELSSQIQNACRESKSLFNAASQQNHAPTAFHRNFTDILIRRFLLSLHVPFAFKSIHDPRFYFSRKICYETSISISCPEPSLDFTNLMAISGGLYRYLSIHCSITFWFEIIIQQEDDKLNGISDRNRQNSNLVAIREGCKNLLDFLEERLFHGETNPKGHMFMSMVLGQIDAIEAGISQEDAIFVSATKAVRSSYEILKSQFHSRNLEALDGEKEQEGEGVSSGNGEVQDAGYEFLQDGILPMDFEFPDSLLFSHAWDEDSWIV